MKDKTLIVVAGPTAVGKTSTAIKLAQHFDTEIISFDSRQFYKGPKIGTASPTEAELKAAPHHFIGKLPLDAYYNVSKFENEALKKLDEIFKHHDYAVAVGGSGLYINALCYGIDELPDADDDLRAKIRKDFEQHGLAYLQNEVKRLDPAYYLIVDQKNPKRLMRALEVCLATGRTYTELRKQSVKERDFNIKYIALNLDRSELFERINHRVDMMIQQGLEEEAKTYEPQKHLNSLNTVGYKELFAYFEGKISKERAIEDIKTNTRRYAKRQIRWFKKDENYHWYSPKDLDAILSFIHSK